MHTSYLMDASKRKTYIKLTALLGVAAILIGCLYATSRQHHPANFMATFRDHYRHGRFDEMFEMTSQESIDLFGQDEIRNCYRQMAFPFDMKYIGATKLDDGYLNLRYDVSVWGMAGVSTVTVKVENKKLKLVLNSLERDWARCIQQGT